mgnify:FL=1
MMLTIAHRFFIDPINAHQWWWALLVPLAFFISVAYKAVRLTSMGHYWRQVGMMTVQILLGLVGLAALSLVVVELIVPRIG